MDEPIAGSLHHVELWVPDLGRAVREWGWLLGQLGYESFQDWPDGRSWRFGGTYLVVEQSPAMTAGGHDRLRPGLNHLAFHAGRGTASTNSPWTVRTTAGRCCSPTGTRTPAEPSTTPPT